MSRHVSRVLGSRLFPTHGEPCPLLIGYGGGAVVNPPGWGRMLFEAKYHSGVPEEGGIPLKRAGRYAEKIAGELVEMCDRIQVAPRRRSRIVHSRCSVRKPGQFEASSGRRRTDGDGRPDRSAHPEDLPDRDPVNGLTATGSSR